RFFVVLLGDEHVERWNNKKRKDRSDSHSTNKHKTDRISCRSAGPGHQREWKVTSDRCNARHHDRTQTNTRRLCDRRQFCQTLPLQLVRKLDDQDSVFRNEPNERDEPNLRVDVERSGPLIRKEFAEWYFQKHEETRAEHGERDRSQQNNERVAEAVELRGQDEKDQHKRKQKHAQKLAAFGAQLARLARVIEHITFRKNVARFVLQKFESSIERNCGHAVDRDCVELLHPIERTRDRFVLNRSDCAQRDELIVRPAHVNIF